MKEERGGRKKKVKRQKYRKGTEKVKVERGEERKRESR